MIFTSVKDELRTKVSDAHFFITSVHTNTNGGNGTDLRFFSLKSILLWMIERLLTHKKPRVLHPAALPNKMWLWKEVVSVLAMKAHMGLEI